MKFSFHFRYLCYICARGDKSLSEKKFKEALELNPENVRTLSLYGCFCHTGLRDYDLAKSYYEKVLVLTKDEHLNTLCCFAELLASPKYRGRDDAR
jgi:tetratricopeptide (TPR) repeat protein